MLEMAGQLEPDDLLLALISGGGSSLLAAPVEGVTLKELRQVTKALLNAGAAIHDINTVRKHLTRLSGGRLALAAAAPEAETPKTGDPCFAHTENRVIASARASLQAACMYISNSTAFPPWCCRTASAAMRRRWPNSTPRWYAP